jgi:8-oxo-dGTP pyrophosphatase MutT (NUDIX family)/RimJ/RimL family protein N-acetyltransferase
MRFSDTDPDRTWDGVAVAPDNPRGCTVVVRRPEAHGFEYLLLHRRSRGAEYEGDWAWTSPAGARQPGEAILSAALRELAEEAGILGAELWPVDLSGDWAVFAVDVPAGTTIELVDPEHDRYEWVPFETARSRVLPSAVSANNYRAVTGVLRQRIGFRAMTHDDLPELVAWRRAPHAARWFDGPADLEEAKERFGARIDGETAHRMHVVELDGLAIGYLFHYLVRAYPDYLASVRDEEAAGIDFLIGDPALCGRGLGPQVIWSYVRDIVLEDHPGVPRVIASPEPDNAPAIRALEKAGFTAGPVMDMSPPEQLCTFDVHRVLGS